MTQRTLQDTINWWQDARFGMFIHWGTYAMAARHEWIRNMEEISEEDYQKYFDFFNPDLFNPKEWAAMAKKAGMKYFVITTKHHEGFCLWDSKFTDYKATNTPCAKDLLREVVDAFRAEGIKVGFYYSLLDWHHPEFTIDKMHPQRNSEEARAKNKDKDISKYAQYMRDQVRELLTEFGEIDILWFDFSYPGEDGKGHEDWESEKLLKMIRELQPQVLVNNRLDLDIEPDFETPEQYTPSEGLKKKDGSPMPWEGCQTFSGSWGYFRDEASWKSPEMLVQMLVNHVSRGGNLLMNVGPTARGEFDYRAIAALNTYAEWMKYHSRSIYSCAAAPEGFEAPEDCRYTYNPETNRLYLHLFAWPFKAIHLKGLAGKVKYAQLLNDASEVKMREASSDMHAGLNEKSPEEALTLELPVIKPPVTVPVIEIFLK